MDKNILIKQTLNFFSDLYEEKPDFVSVAPGRINIIGEHTDYNHGLAMPAAIDRYICVALAQNNTKQINAHSMKFKKTLSCDIDTDMVTELWHKYVMGVIHELNIEYDINRGLDILIHSNLDIGSGISSSAALEIAITNAVLHLFRIDATDAKKIELCQRVEHNHINIKSGVLDQSASLLSKDGYLLILNFEDLTHRYIKNSFNNSAWVLVDSMIKRKLANSKYHERVLECSNAIKQLKKISSNINNLSDISKHDLRALSNLDPAGYKRAQHIIDENARVYKMESAILCENLVEMGSILTDSHLSLRDLYEVSSIENDYLVEISSKFSGWYGGRIMGGGFGGNTINLVKKDRALEYSKFIKKKYLDKFQIMPNIRTVNFSEGAKIVNNIRAF